VLWILIGALPLADTLGQLIFCKRVKIADVSSRSAGALTSSAVVSMSFFGRRGLGQLPGTDSANHAA